MVRFAFALIVVYLCAGVASEGCAKRELPHGVVCVCNSTYCDTIEPLGKFKDNEAIVYLTNIEGARMERSIIQKSPKPTGSLLTLDPSTAYQEIMGFGGSFTDSTGSNLLSLSNATREKLMNAYFGPTGSEYTLGRVPIASTDFSPSEYSYNDNKGDFAMEKFALVDEDFTLKLPFIRQAASLQKDLGGLKLVAAPWSAPGWMKGNNIMEHGGTLRGFEGGPYWVAWATYFVKFFEAYNKEGVQFWAAEVQNEPRSGADHTYRWQSMYWSPENEAKFVANHLSPALKNSSVTKDLKILALTDQRGALPEWPKKYFANSAARAVTSGLSVHWYEDQFKNPDVLTQTHDAFPDQFLIASEASNGFMDPKPVRMRPGDYSRAEKYAQNIMEDLNHWVTGWIDWNLALDLQGGPSWVQNWLDATILVDASADEFWKQPSYYALAHFSKFLKPGSRRVALVSEEKLDVDSLGAVAADGSRVVVLMNTDKSKTVRLSIADKSRSNGVINVDLAPRSIVTVVWK